MFCFLMKANIIVKIITYYGNDMIYGHSEHNIMERLDGRLLHVVNNGCGLKLVLSIKS